MGAAKKFELAPDEVYIQEALKDGRATIQEVSMKALGRPDVAFQARVKHIDMDHVHRLSLIHDQEGKLSPIVVFRAVLGAIVRWIMADGFHRHEVYRRKGERAIRAYVVDVPMDSIEHEARLFAAMCNQVTLLARTPQDVRRAVELLFADPECWQWANKRIATHVGLSPTSVARFRQEFSLKNQIKMPDIVVDKDGKERPFKTSQSTGIPHVTRVTSRGGSRFRANHDNRVFDGKTPEALSSMIDKHKQDQKTMILSLDRDTFRNRLLTVGILTEKLCLNLGRYGRIAGFGTISAVFVVVPDPDCDAIRRAVGDLYIFSRYSRFTGLRKVIVAYMDSFPGVMADIVRNSGIEILTPDELVESLKGEEGS